MGLGSLVLLTAQFLNAGGLLYGTTFSLRLLLLLPLLTLVTAAAAALWSVKGWRHSGAGLIAHIHQAVLLAGLVALMRFLAEWNLIGWQF